MSAIRSRRASVGFRRFSGLGMVSGGGAAPRGSAYSGDNGNDGGSMALDSTVGA